MENGKIGGIRSNSEPPEPTVTKFGMGDYYYLFITPEDSEKMQT